MGTKPGLLMGKNFMTKSKLYSSLLPAAAAICLSALMGASAQAYVCFNTSSFSKMFGTTLRSDYLLRPHTMAQLDEKYPTIPNFFANSDLDLLNEFNKSITHGCKVIVGLYTSRECLLVGPVAVQKNVLVLSPTCGHNDIEKHHPHILTGVPAIRDYIHATVSRLESMPTGTVFVFYQPTDVFSEVSYSSFKKAYIGKYHTVAIDRDGKIKDPAQIGLLPINGSNPKMTALFFAYPMPSSTVLGQLDQVGFITPKLRIIGNSAWIFDIAALSTLKNLFNRTDGVYLPDVLDRSKLRQSSFYRDYRAKFNEDPVGIQYMSYDVTRLALRCLKKSKTFNLKSYRGCLNTNGYTGPSGIIRFKLNSPFADRPIFFTDFKDVL
jgi:ABC-type branched-subunit amino acid transport system substrate-binding protein